MKFSELDKSKLSLDEKYELIMHGIKNYANTDAKESEKVDFLIVLGCRPATLKARVVKAAELYKRNYARYVLFSGGLAWNNKIEKGSKKDLDMIEAVRESVLPGLLGEEPSEKQQNVEKEFRLLSGETDITPEDKIRKLSECQLMSRMMITLAGVPAENIYHEPFSNNTIENIKNTAALFRNLQRPNNIGAINKVMIVTSSFHCRRAMLAFKKYLRNIEICSCPSTLDFKDKGITFCKADMLGHEYYRRQIENELDAIINYTRKGSIEDCDISLVVGEEMAKEIERRQIEVEF